MWHLSLGQLFRVVIRQSSQKARRRDLPEFYMASCASAGILRMRHVAMERRAIIWGASCGASLTLQLFFPPVRDTKYSMQRLGAEEIRLNSHAHTAILQNDLCLA